MPQRQAIMRNHPQTVGLDTRVLEQGVTACLDCAATLRSCADISLTRADVASRRYLVRSLMDGADVCQATARLLLRQTAPGLQPLKKQLEACLRACQVCDAESQRYARRPGPERLSSEACSACVESCKRLLLLLG